MPQIAAFVSAAFRFSVAGVASPVPGSMREGYDLTGRPFARGRFTDRLTGPANVTWGATRRRSLRERSPPKVGRWRAADGAGSSGRAPQVWHDQAPPTSAPDEREMANSEISTKTLWSPMRRLCSNRRRRGAAREMSPLREARCVNFNKARWTRVW